MPTNTFFKLPKEKQDAICVAGKKEFSRVSFEEASINKIVMTAGISRGSFYMYFHDKEDLYLYLIKKQHKKIEKSFVQTLEENQGDLIQTYIEIFEKIVTHIDKGKTQDFFKKSVTNSNFGSDPFFKEVKKEPRLKELAYQKINRKKLSVQSDVELYDMIDLIHTLFIHNLVKMVKFERDKEEVYQTFVRQMMMLRNGLYKQEEEKHD